jgi:hypothetical protein
MVRSLPATSIQLGLFLQAAVVIVAEKLSAKLSTCERAMNAEGPSGDMTWTPSNRAVRDQAELGLDLFFFERVQRKDGLWRFAQTFYYFSHKLEQRPDKAGNTRAAIVFGLLSVTATATEIVASVPETSLDALRTAALATVDPEKLGVQPAIRNVYLRSEAVRRYALGRAGGTCEACGFVAPFRDTAGMPFLEVHHIDRLADSGPDRVDRVAQCAQTVIADVIIRVIDCNTIPHCGPRLPRSSTYASLGNAISPFSIAKPQPYQRAGTTAGAGRKTKQSRFISV